MDMNDLNKFGTESHTLETRYEIWNDRTGERIDVGPDRDGLDMIEIVYVGDDGVKGQCVCMTKAQAKLVAEALLKSIQS